MTFCQFRLSLVFGVLSAALSISPRLAAQHQDPVLETAQLIERELQARVGYAIHDTGNDREWRYRDYERFPMASTAKTLACGALLKQGQAAMTQTVLLQQEDILPYGPVTRNWVGKNVSASQLCAATLATSDNTALNGVLKVLGGPQAVTAFLRSIGDQTTRTDRTEPELNEGRPGDLRDTTTPRAMQQTLEALLLGNALDCTARAQLTEWMENNTVSGALLRAGIPSDWRIADRTGNGGFGTRGAIAVIWPPGRAPIVAAVYLTETPASLQQRDAAIAAIGRAITSAVMREPVDDKSGKGPATAPCMSITTTGTTNASGQGAGHPGTGSAHAR